MKGLIPTTEYNREQAVDMVRQFAIEWQSWSSGVSMSMSELALWADIFEGLANWADSSGDLLEEFKENGIV